MGGRLNWDRVRTETLSRRHGSEWVNPFAEQYSYSRPNRQKKRRKKPRHKKSDPTGRSNGWVHVRQTNRIQRSAQKAMPHVSA